jgi:hypothetical protein
MFLGMEEFGNNLKAKKKLLNASNNIYIHTHTRACTHINTHLNRDAGDTIFISYHNMV